MISKDEDIMSRKISKKINGNVRRIIISLKAKKYGITNKNKIVIIM